MPATLAVQGPFTQAEFDEVMRRIDVLRTQYPTVAFETTASGDDILAITIKVPVDAVSQSDLQLAYDGA